MRLVDAFLNYSQVSTMLSTDRVNLSGDKQKLSRNPSDIKTINLAKIHLSNVEKHVEAMNKFYTKFGIWARIVVFINAFIGNSRVISKTEKLAAEVRKLVQTKQKETTSMAAPGESTRSAQVGKQLIQPKEQDSASKRVPPPVEIKKSTEPELPPYDKAAKGLVDKLIEISYDDIEREEFINYFSNQLNSYPSEEEKINFLQSCTKSIQLIQDLHKPTTIVIKLNKESEINEDFIKFLAEGIDIQAASVFKLTATKPERFKSEITGKESSRTVFKIE